MSTMVKKIHIGMKKRSGPGLPPDDDDLLQHLDVAFEREQGRERQRQARARKKLKRADHEQYLKPVSSDDQDRCMRHLREALGAEGLDESVCCVCDRLVLARDVVRVDGNDWKFINKLRGILDVHDDSIPERLAKQYRAPPHIDGLENVLVSPRGIHCFVNEGGYPSAWIGICEACMVPIRRATLPKFAIANGFFVGHLPKHLRGLTLPERFMTQLTSMSAITRVMRGGQHRCIRSHCLAFDCTPGAPVSMLPRSIKDVTSYRVVMVGEFTREQASKVKKMHRVRNEQVRDVFNFYKAFNRLYDPIVPSDDVLNTEFSDEVIDNQFADHVEDSSEVLNDEVSIELESVRGQSDAWPVDLEDEHIVLERRVGLMDDTSRASARENSVISEVGNAASTERSFMIRRSNQFSSDTNGDLFARLFPHLFPFGRGHPGESRRIPVSMKETIKHYISLSSRQFAEDELFSLVAFDRISLQNMYIQNSVRCKRFPDVFAGFETIGVEALSQALIANEQRRQGCMPQSKVTDDTTARFLKSVEVASSAVWGSNAERGQCRQKAFAYQARFGQPALFVTLTPNTDNSFAMAHYTGLISVATLFDALEAKMPSKAELREASLHNDCASARLFMRQVDAFIHFVLGIDPKSKKTMDQQGLFGEVEAYFGMVETQGRGNLHVHFLIWLRDGPSNSADVDEMLAGDGASTFCKSVEEYANSIVSNKIPLELSSFRCSRCGGSFAYMSALPVPEIAHKNPQAGLYNQQAKMNVTEPVLIECGVCKMQFSSQHMMRSVLLNHRPLHWPSWENSVSLQEIRAQADREMPCRASLREAMHAVLQREILESSLSSERKVESKTAGGPVGIADWLEYLNVPQMKLCKRDNDPFQNDELTRLIEMLPPSTADARMSRATIDYMVSTLVLLLNQHWWCHTNTCFKQSRMTLDSSFCRYGFPKDRVACTQFKESGVEMCRPLGHEFVNGYNRVIMATFKCNHDVQVLIGGQEATHRIHYCCKYVTKEQKRLDSVVAIALGSFKRRQERELLENLTSAGETQATLATARKRVASMVYSMTSRQEVAGPLAALYLYRGSCCYASTACSSIALGDIIRQLLTAEEYSCNLVRECNEFGDSTFRTVSCLDDYIYRHAGLAGLSIYEFSMKYFRKKDEGAIDSKFGFLSGHPLHRTHSLGQRFQDVVPVIRGYRLPYVTSESSMEFQYKRAILSLVLFKPFRSIVDLIGDGTVCDEVWLEAFDRWEPTRSDFVKSIMNNMSDYYSGLNHAKKHSADRDNSAEKDNHGEPISTGVNYENDHDDLYDVEDALDFEDFDDDGEDSFEPSSLWDLSEGSDAIVESSCLHPSVCPSAAVPEARIMHIIDAFRRFGMINTTAKKTASEARATRQVIPAVSTYRMGQWINDCSTDNSLLLPNSERLDIQETEVVELFDRMVEDANTVWHPAPMIRSELPKQVKQFASITSVSRSFTLNEKQHFALKRIGLALLTRWRKSETMGYVDGNVEDALRSDQLRFFLGGEGGTGKSRVIEAVQTLCISWGRSRCLVKTALTGKAATLIEGRTLESFLLQLNGDKSIGAATELDLLIIDEVSMMKRLQLVQLDRRLRIAKRLPNVPFGGVHIVLVGDFLQLPPVGADPIYRDPSSRPKSTATDFAGFHLWRSFEDVIVLDDSVRFQEDPVWGHGCHEARLGIWSHEFVSLINSRVVNPHDNSIMNWISSDERTTFVTPDNSTRLSINNLFISTAAKLLPINEHPVRIVANFKGKLRGLNRAEAKAIMSLPDSKFGRMAPYLDLIIGMPIQVTQNIRPQKMVANGSLGTLESIIYCPGTTFRVVHDTAADTLVKIPSEPPTAVIVRLPRGNTASPMLGCSDSELFPLFFKSAYRSSEVRLAGMLNCLPRVLSVRIEQFPLVSAVASTIYKVQGDTLRRMVVTEWKSKTSAANKPEQPYLLVSRVTSRHAFLTLSPLTPEIIRWARPSPYALQEEQRLLSLSDLTIRLLSL